MASTIIYPIFWRLNLTQELIVVIKQCSYFFSNERFVSEIHKKNIWLKILLNLDSIRSLSMLFLLCLTAT